MKTPIAPNPARYVRPGLFEAITGYTRRAVEGKIRDGVWTEGIHYRYAPDGNILIDLEGYYRWVEGKAA